MPTPSRFVPLFVILAAGCAVGASGCSSGGVSTTVKPAPVERTFWKACWGVDDFIDVETDTPPHDAPCEEHFTVKWDLPIRIVTNYEPTDPGFLALVEAMVRWNTEIGLNVFTIGITDAEVLVLRQDPMPGIGGMADIKRLPDGEGMVGVVVVYGDQGVWVHMHELGHILGLAHDKPGSESVMAQYSNNKTDPTPTRKDVAALRRLYGKR